MFFRSFIIKYPVLRGESSDVSVCVRMCLICWVAVVVASLRAAKCEVQMSANSEHEFEGRVCGEIFG